MRFLQSKNNTLFYKEKANILSIFAIALFAFAAATALYLSGGIFISLEHAFSSANVNPSDVELIISMYGLGLVLSTPVVIITSYKIGYKNLFILSFLLFIIANLIISFSTNWVELLCFRFVFGISMGILLSVGILVIIDLMPKRNKLLSGVIFYGSFYLTTFTLVPILIWWCDISATNSNILMQGWRWSFFITVLLALIAFVLLLKFLPKKPLKQTKSNFKTQLKSLFYWPYFMTSILLMLLFFCIFMVYPILQEQWTSQEYGIIHYVPEFLPILLLFFGLLAFLGNFTGRFFLKNNHLNRLYLVLLALIFNLIILIIVCIYKDVVGILLFSLTFAFLAYMVIPSIYDIASNLSKYRNKKDPSYFQNAFLTFFLGLGLLISDVINGPMTTHEIWINNEYFKVYNPNYFANILYVVLSVVVMIVIGLFIVTWYINSAKLVVLKNAFFSYVFAKLPLIIDNYSTQDVINEIYNNKQINPKLKIIDKSKKKK